MVMTTCSTKSARTTGFGLGVTKVQRSNVHLCSRTRLELAKACPLHRHCHLTVRKLGNKHDC